MSEVLAPGGPQAAHIAQLWWLMLAICAFVFIAVTLALGCAVLRARRATSETAPESPSTSGEKRVGLWVKAAAALSMLLLVILLGASVMTDRALARLPLDDALVVHVTANQWWWDVVYEDAQPDREFRTANELYLPTGRPVIVKLDARDVIHSFWIPSLTGKKDLLPGRTTTIQFRADKAGEYRAPCAEFCGLQHAFMTLDVVALAPASFDAWADAHRAPAAAPSDPMELRGRELFVSGSCMLCHAILGTSANARSGPDLTHVASRAHLASVLPNTRVALAAWITDPQVAKPGANMPAHFLADADMRALLAYLGTLR